MKCILIGQYDLSYMETVKSQGYIAKKLTTQDNQYLYTQSDEPLMAYTNI